MELSNQPFLFGFNSTQLRSATSFWRQNFIAIHMDAFCIMGPPANLLAIAHATQSGIDEKESEEERVLQFKTGTKLPWLRNRCNQQDIGEVLRKQWMKALIGSQEDWWGFQSWTRNAVLDPQKQLWSSSKRRGKLIVW